MWRVVIGNGTYLSGSLRSIFSTPQPKREDFLHRCFGKRWSRDQPEFSPDELSRPPARYDSIIGPGDRSLSKSGDAATVAQKICLDVGAYVRCADRELRSVALVFLFLGGR